ncbi:hypothetical protein [Vibrio cidicii]|uniref:hypothetical protein n=1 Tax=Vibrio cidicii TaxID=1763883 RepID=UPI0037042FD2
MLNFVRTGSMLSGVSSFIACCFIISGNYNESYLYTSIYPLVFLFVFKIILILNIAKKFPVSIYSFVVLSWIRFVLMPPLLLWSSKPELTYLNPQHNSIEFATLLPIYEIVFVMIFILFVSKVFCPVFYLNDKVKTVEGSSILYVAFIVLALLIFFTYPASRELVNFVYIRVGSSGERAGDVTGTVDILIRQIFIVALSLLVVISAKFACKYGDYNKWRFLLVVFFAILTILFIVGERRTAQIYSCFSAVAILFYLYPAHKKKILILLLSPAFVVIISMSVYKFFGAFLYDSYSDAIGQSSFINQLPSLLQIYFFGPQNIALSMDFIGQDNSSVIDFILDLLRSIFGVSFLLKDYVELTSIRFNEYIYGHGVKTGQVLSSLSYGVLYFTIIFSPIVTCLNLTISLSLEWLMKNCSSIEFTYLFAMLLIRVSSNIYGPTPAVISYVSMSFIIFGLVFGFSIVFNKALLDNEKNISPFNR